MFVTGTLCQQRPNEKKVEVVVNFSSPKAATDMISLPEKQLWQWVSAYILYGLSIEKQLKPDIPKEAS